MEFAFFRCKNTRYVCCHDCSKVGVIDFGDDQLLLLLLLLLLLVLPFPNKIMFLDFFVQKCPSSQNGKFRAEMST
jgi:hypothetical protein